MKSSKSVYKRHRFPPEIIQYVVWVYPRFNLSHRDVEDLMAERGITVSCELSLFQAVCLRVLGKGGGDVEVAKQWILGVEIVNLSVPIDGLTCQCSFIDRIIAASIKLY